jgi:RNA polymerase sigma factor (sigma-70 family)
MRSICAESCYRPAVSSDFELLTAWREGDKTAGSELFGRHFDSLYRFFASKVGDNAEELVQRSFVAALESVARFRGEASVRTWMFAIARNILRQWIWERGRATDREQVLEENSVAALGIGPSTAIDLAREHKLLAAGLQRIPIDSQIVLELFYWEKLTGAEIASVLDCAEGTLRGRITRARQQLRAELDQIVRTKEELDSSMDGLETWAAKMAMPRVPS